LIGVIVRRHLQITNRQQMKYINLTTLILGLILFGYNQTDTKTTWVTREKVSASSKDKEQIQNLIRQVLNWADTNNSIDFLPTITDSKNSFYIGFDLGKHKQNLVKLRQADLFSTEFIDNYNQIILTLDKGLRNGKYEEWLVGDLPPFTFVSDVNPWCLCQDVPDDTVNPWDFVEIRTIYLDKDKGEASWDWGKLEFNTHPSWKDFSYNFKVVKENHKWKIAYLQGFDFKESTK